MKYLMNMAIEGVIAVLMACLMTVSEASAQTIERKTIRLSEGWQFAFGNAADPKKDFGCGTEYFNYLTKANSIHNEGPYTMKFDSSDWQEVNIPHDWVATLPYARQFMQVILLGNVITHMYFGMNAVLRSAGKPRHAMWATLFTVGMNIVLVVAFVWWLRLGIRGAALATVASQSMALAWQVWTFCDRKELLHLKRGIYRLRGQLVRNIVAIGISPFLMQTTSCVIVIFMNNQFVRYGGDMAVGAYSIANSVVMALFMFVMGMTQGMQPIVGYNYGAEKYGRMLRCLWLTIASATVFLLVGWSLSMLFPRQIVRIFTSDATLIDMSAHGLKFDMLVFFVVGSQAVITNFFQCIGKVRISIFLSLSRQLILLLPLALVLPLWWGLDGVWAAMPASDFLAFAFTLPVLAWYLKKLPR